MKKKIGVEVLNLTKNYYHGKKISKNVFDQFSTSFEKGKIHCILGVSGCGKSTLLRMIAGIESFDSGEIQFPEITNLDSLFLAMILQENNLLPWLSVFQNVEFALKASGMDLSHCEIDEILKKYSLWEYRDFYPYQLSVGLRQKVAFCKTISSKPKILLLDEPFSALDFLSKEVIYPIYYDAFQKEKFTSILTTHSIEEAVKLGDYIHLIGKNHEYQKIKNPLKFPRERDVGYQDFIDKIKNLYC